MKKLTTKKVTLPKPFRKWHFLAGKPQNVPVKPAKPVISKK